MYLQPQKVDQGQTARLPTEGKSATLGSPRSLPYYTDLEKNTKQNQSLLSKHSM